MDFEKHEHAIYIISNIIIIVSCFLGLLLSLCSFFKVRKIRMTYNEVGNGVEGDDMESVDVSTFDDKSPSSPTSSSEKDQSRNLNIFEIYSKIRKGAFAYIQTEFFFFAPILILLDSFLILFIGLNKGFLPAVLSGICFITGALTSLLCGALGMSIATFANARTTIGAKKNIKTAFVTSFTAAQCYGFLLPSIGIATVLATVNLLKLYYGADSPALYTTFASFGLGGSIAGLFARISGGIFTKAADVGADMVGKVEKGLEEDDPRNPAVIADNVGDNVGDIAGMGADLFGSFGEAISSSFIIIANSKTLSAYPSTELFPLVYMALALDVAMFTSFFATYFDRPEKESQVEVTLKKQILVFTFLMLVLSAFICHIFLPAKFNVAKADAEESFATPWSAFVCLSTGIIGGAFVGMATEYFTSSSFTPVRELAESSETGAGTVVIYGLSLGHRSTFLPALTLGFMMYLAYYMAEYFGVVMMALGLLAFTSVILTIDAYGPICDNAGGIAEMSGLPEEVRARTDALDAAGNTTAAIGKGFAICLAYVVGMALLTSFVRLVDLDSVNTLNAFPLLGLFVGASFPYLFCSDLNKSVGYAAQKMVLEVRRQFENDKIADGKQEPNYKECINVATRASLRRTVFPFLLTLAPIPIGFLFGKKTLTGFIIGVQISGVPLAISSNNSGGAWDNAKKYIEAGHLGEQKGKNSPCHHAAVVGDTVGDPMKDTSGPSINTLLKVVAIISVVFASVFPKEGYLEMFIS